MDSSHTRTRDYQIKVVAGKTKVEIFHARHFMQGTWQALWILFTGCCRWYNFILCEKWLEIFMEKLSRTINYTVKWHMTDSSLHWDRKFQYMFGLKQMHSLSMYYWLLSDSCWVEEAFGFFDVAILIFLNPLPEWSRAALCNKAASKERIRS